MKIFDRLKKVKDDDGDMRAIIKEIYAESSDNFFPILEAIQGNEKLCGYLHELWWDFHYKDMDWK